MTTRIPTGPGSKLQPKISAPDAGLSAAAPVTPPPLSGTVSIEHAPPDRFIVPPPSATPVPLGSEPLIHRGSPVQDAGIWGAEAGHPPRDLVLPWDLSGKSAPAEKSLLKLTGGKGGLFAVGDWKPGAKPLVLVHGISADFADLQPIVDKFRDDPKRQIYVFAYDDDDRYTGDNGVDLGKELKALRDRYPWTGELDVVAHSMGGIIARRGLDELVAGKEGGIDKFERIRFVAVDTPWHGFPGPGWRLPFYRGAMDMQARSELFQGNSGSSDAAEKKGLFGVQLPANVETHIISADNLAAGGKPDAVLDYTDNASNHFGADLAHLPEVLQRYLGASADERRGDWAKGLDVYAVNYLRALTSDRDWPAAETRLQDLRDREHLEPVAIARTLVQTMPRYAGEHTGVLKNADLLRDLKSLLG